VGGTKSTPQIFEMGYLTSGIVGRMNLLQRRWLIRLSARVAAAAIGLLVVLATAVALDMQEQEPTGTVVVLVLGAAAVLAIILGRVTYRAVLGLLSR
jgi:hypothetical protein